MKENTNDVNSCEQGCFYLQSSGHERKDRRKLISICIPIYNEVENLEPLLEKLDELAKQEPHYEFEFLFTDNASTDGSFDLLEKLAKTDSRLRGLRFSRNFGFQKSILTNLQNARGDAAVQIDADLQDSPLLISDFLRRWEKGYKVVYGVRRQRKEWFLVNWARSFFYWIIDKLSDTGIPRGAGDFRLIDRALLEYLKVTNEHSPYLRGLVAELGYPQTGVIYDRDLRLRGESKFNLARLIELAIDGVTAQSTRPLRFLTYLGFFILLSSGLFFAYLMVAIFIFSADAPSGFSTVVFLLFFGLGLNALGLGLIGEYVGRIFNNTRGLPLSIIQETLDVGQRKDFSHSNASIKKNIPHEDCNHCQLVQPVALPLPNEPKR